MSTPSPVVVGIDLGTTNSAVASWQPRNTEEELPARKIPAEPVRVDQIVSQGATAALSVLPSFLYLPHAGELAPTDTRLPWEVEGSIDAVVGTFAKERGALAPERQIASAKSWLCARHVDRHAPVLPWRSPVPAEQKLSPVAVSAHYLRHLTASFAHTQRQLGNADEPTAWDVVLTVPASFDEVARNLTLEAASEAGLTRVSLLEEPLAAFYAWLDARGDSWRSDIQPGDLVLVLDVGGGTTDLSLIAVTEKDDKLALERISVGDHLLLGGDNMDLALAHALKAQLAAEGHTLDNWQFMGLVSSARAAKEAILADPDLAEAPISVVKRGASLFAGTIATRLDRSLCEKVLLDGFLPMVDADARPSTRRVAAMQELGLAYEPDAGISRHLARFLARSAENVASSPELAQLAGHRSVDGGKRLVPTAVLFNGGVFKAPALRERVLALLTAWNGDEPVHALSGAEPDLAVALGAAAYGRLRATGKGMRVRSGTARSYYIGLESPMPAVPGYTPPVQGLCIVPQGTDEGVTLAMPDETFGLVVGEPVEFRFFSSAVRAGDHVGSLASDAAAELDESSHLQITLPAEGHRAGEVVPVRLEAVVTAIGTLQLAMVEVAGAGAADVESGARWRLEFDVRGSEA